ncbi:hypothetical protein [Amycolatopsis mediterranei]|uniref:Uncharacterized protein n=1 Tax=Amycolatopsis mediterranei (strain S699) TaxID=713604 RepID=A0A9R0UAH1_AMYMS|nr:hypothetical protein [Amycolatopsis mediterranei]AEK43929.1 hypothetical protein RAM_27260 [Amycolatopsis mediterranei S699]UZF68266.1 hypothetical protein ISP_001323 [Amycolatopsis mediterranei]
MIETPDAIGGANPASAFATGLGSPPGRVPVAAVRVTSRPKSGMIRNSSRP